MGGRSGNLTQTKFWSNIVYIPCTRENNFVPELQGESGRYDLPILPETIPTGVALNKTELKKR